MINYETVTGRLTRRQILRLLADVTVLSEPAYTAAGIPPLVWGSPDSLPPEAAVSPRSLIHAWDTALTERCAAQTARLAGETGINCITAPAARQRLGVFSAGLGEDALLTAPLSAAYRRAFAAAGLAYFIDGIGTDADDAAWMGPVPDPRTTDEAVAQPERQAWLLSDGRPAGVVCGAARSPAYRETDAALLKAVTAGESPLLFCRDVSPADTVKALQAGKILIGADETVLDNAVREYETMQQAIARGRDTLGHLEALVNAGTALPDTVVTDALHRVLDFAFSLSPAAHPQETEENDDALSREAAAACTVLLRNEKLLPLPADPAPDPKRPRRKVKQPVTVIVGSMALSEDGSNPLAARLAENGIRISGYADGYDRRSVRGSEDKVREAVSLCVAADRVIFVLGRSPREDADVMRFGSCALPARQLQLADALRPFGDKTTLLVSSGAPFDTAFADGYAGLLSVPAAAPYVWETAADILCGRTQPGGHLAFTLYRDAAAAARGHESDRRRFRLRTGPFFGYRDGDANGIPPAFCFGHGLTYTTFAVSGLRREGDELVCRVRNTGRRPGTAVPQVYAGMAHTACVRPVSQLCGYTRVTLGPHESRLVRIPLTLPTVPDPASGQPVTEAGKYMLSVGFSLEDVRARITVKAGQAVLQPSGEPLCRYLTSESDIVRDGYTLEASYKMKKTFPKFLILGVILLALAVGIRFLIPDAGNLFPSVAALLLLLCAVACFICEILERRRVRDKAASEIEVINDRFFREADSLPVENAARLFVDDTIVRTLHETDTAAAAAADEEFRSLDRDFTFAAAAEELVLYARARGLKLETAAARSLLAAMSASRMLLTDGMTEAETETLHSLLSDWFDTPAYADRMDDSVRTEAGLLVTAGPASADRPLADAVTAAARDPKRIYLFRLSDISLSARADCLNPLCRYAASPLTENRLVISPERSMTLPSNLWLLMEPAAGSDVLHEAPGLLLEASCVVTLRTEPCAAEPMTKELHRLGAYQMKYLVERARSALSVGEDVWKRLDAVADFARAHGGLRLSNRVWNGVEQFTASAAAAGLGEAAALDAAMAARLLPSVIRAAGRVNPEEKTLADVLEESFSADGCPASAAAARRTRMPIVTPGVTAGAESADSI